MPDLKQFPQKMLVELYIYSKADIFLLFKLLSDTEPEKQDPDPLSFATAEDPTIRLKWTAHLEFTQNHIAGDLTWDKVMFVLTFKIF